MARTADAATIYQRPVEILQALVRFDTTNPPGNEAACIGYIRELLAAAGIEATLVARDPARPNLIARLQGQGSAPPLLLYGHVDVVTAEGQQWTHPPFASEIADGFLWGRGTLDMKGGVAMLLAAFLRARVERAPLPGDVIFAALADEEVHSEHGALFLVTEHPEHFAGVRYALGELGGFTHYLGARRLYPIMVAEKRFTQLRATIRGPGGHGSLPLRGAATAKLARFLRRLDRHRLPVHVTPPVREMIAATADALPLPAGLVLRQLCSPLVTDRVLDLLGPLGTPFDPLLHNTANPTLIHGGEKVNVIPSEITVEMDGRLVPGCTAEDLRAEALALAGDDAEIAIIYPEDGAVAPHDMGLYPTLAAILREADPAGAGSGDRRALLRPARHPDVWLHPDAAAQGLRFRVAPARGGRAGAGGGAGLRRRRDLPGTAALRRGGPITGDFNTQDTEESTSNAETQRDAEEKTEEGCCETLFTSARASHGSPLPGVSKPRYVLHALRVEIHA